MKPTLVLFKSETTAAPLLCVKVPAKVVKKIGHLIAYQLSIIFNLCINNGYFPDILKTARVTPISMIKEKKNEELPSDICSSNFQ